MLGGFFRRINDVDTIVKISIIRPILIMWSPFFVFSNIGFSNYGMKFFSIRHWITTNGVLITPLAGIFCTIMIFSICMFVTMDILLARGSYVAVKGNEIIIKRRLNYKIKDIDLECIRFKGWKNNILAIKFKNTNKDIEISLAFVLDSSKISLEDLRKKLTDVA